MALYVCYMICWVEFWVILVDWVRFTISECTVWETRFTHNFPFQWYTEKQEKTGLFPRWSDEESAVQMSSVESIFIFGNWCVSHYRCLLLLHQTSRSSQKRHLRHLAVPSQAWPTAKSLLFPHQCWFPLYPLWAQSVLGARSKPLQSSKSSKVYLASRWRPYCSLYPVDDHGKYLVLIAHACQSVSYIVVCVFGDHSSEECNCPK